MISLEHPMCIFFPFASPDFSNNTTTELKIDCIVINTSEAKRCENEHTGSIIASNILYAPQYR
uniref:Uncharacterized protein n=1 Tax=Arundo donax TaxID=35708 RepID=A0A0A9EEB6_ARUDO